MKYKPEPEDEGHPFSSRDLSLGRPSPSLRKPLNQLPLYTIWVGLRQDEAVRAEASPPCYTSTVGGRVHAHARMRALPRSLTHESFYLLSYFQLWTRTSFSRQAVRLDLCYWAKQEPQASWSSQATCEGPKTRTCSETRESHFLTFFGSYKHNRV